MSQNKEITIYDIAKSLNISPATVSRGLKDHPAINKDTKKKIIDAAQKMGYRHNTFASNLRRQRTNILGVIVPRLNSSFTSDVIAGMEKTANEAGFNLVISQSLETMKKEVANANTMFNNRVDGLLVSLAYDTTDIQHLENFINKNIPVIFFDRVYDHEKCPSIKIDNYKAAYEITAHLISQGCKKIAHITGNQLRNVYQDRFNGYKQALADHAIPLNEKHVFINDLSGKAGAETAEKILYMNDRPDGVFSANDTCAINCMQVLMKNGISIPQDIAFAGFNNDPTSTIIEPNLTSVNYKGFEMGEVAARILIGHLNNNYDLQLTHTLMLRHELIMRDSSLRK
ncbi:substrate-binding domain-containing protein [Pedobacter sp. HMF7647]|uniref:Substrate-binding domain-containing protein n=1 Tax=Hufsiella arboris TaxID=2695275 RepID=A0A7K1YDF7_9SPHI|nr:LacI family DNA-binding transcriptional regulator [Hufsiella arboris]MXV52624.1 substrate-binding domain-containing protein [Hufsiella arboris]